MSFRFLERLEGPQTRGRGPLFWIGFALVVAAAASYPLFSDGYTIGNTVYFLTWTFMAMGLSLIWGYGGALSFGQTAFFGVPLCLWRPDDKHRQRIRLHPRRAAAVGAAGGVFAAVIGYFLFFGRITACSWAS